MMPILLHGALGVWDEVAFGICVPMLVIVVLYISWANAENGSTTRPIEDDYGD